MIFPAVSSRPGWFRRIIGLALLLVAASVRAQALDPLPPPSALKKMSVDQLMDIVVTSVSKRPERLLGTASAIQVVTDDDIRRSGATSLPEALRLASNLEVARIDSRQWAITARGFNNVFADKMLVLIDGRTVYTPLYAGVYWDVQDTLLADLDRIEVISGPGATQWGSNAVNGVINITTKSAKDTQGAWISGGLGSQLRQSAEARYGGRAGSNVYYRVYGKYSDRGDSLLRNGRDSNDAWHLGQTGFRLDWDTPAGDLVTWQGDAYNGSIGQTGPDNIRVNGENILGRWSRSFSPGSDIKVQLYYDRTHRRIPGSFTQDINTCDLDVQHRRDVGSRQTFVAGVNWRLVADDVANTPANAFLPPSTSRQSGSAFVQDEIKVVPDLLHLTLGSKVERNNYTGTEYEPSGRIAWTPANRQTVWAAVSRAVRTPSRIDRDLFSPATPPYRIAGGEKVVSEKVLAYELGYRVQPSPSFAVAVATFYNIYDDLRSLEPLTPPRAFPVTASSGLRGRSEGAELTADWRVSPAWRLRAGWTEMRVHSERQPGNSDRSTRDSISRDPNHELSLRSLLDISPRWELDTTARYVSSINMQSVPGYTEADVRLGWRYSDSWEFSLVGQNLLHPHHPEFNPPGSRRQIQRSVYGRASWRF